MKSLDHRSRFRNRLFDVPVAMVCGALLLPPSPLVLAQQAESPVITTTTQGEEEAPKIPNDQLDSLVAPIALYPDPLLSQALVASTYPLEIIQLEQWMAKNKNLKDKALADAVAKQPWDPSIQGLAAFPDVVTRLAENIAWTSDLGNAFLSQQADVMAAVQRMRAKATGTGNLKTSAQQKVETQTVDGKEVIVVQQANPEVVYVPSYDPVVVYGPPVYPYPSYSYPGYVPGMALAFGTGLVLGAAWGGGWGYGCGWGRGDVNINYNNNYNRNNINNVNRNNINRSGNNQWQHNAAHRGSVPYGNRQTANKYGGTARNPSNRQPGAGPNNRPGGGTGPGNRPGGGTGPGNRPGGGTGPGNRPGGGTGPGNRPGGGTGPGNRPGGGTGPSTKPATRPSGGGANSIGNRSVRSSPSGAFGGGSGGSARSASSRGGHSMGGGGFSGGGSRGGGGGGRGGGRRR